MLQIASRSGVLNAALKSISSVRFISEGVVYLVKFTNIFDGQAKGETNIGATYTDMTIDDSAFSVLWPSYENEPLSSRIANTVKKKNCDFME
jgi:hypothetical protein